MFIVYSSFNYNVFYLIGVMNVGLIYVEFNSMLPADSQCNILCILLKWLSLMPIEFISHYNPAITILWFIYAQYDQNHIHLVHFIYFDTNLSIIFQWMKFRNTRDDVHYLPYHPGYFYPLEGDIHDSENWDCSLKIILKDFAMEEDIFQSSSQYQSQINVKCWLCNF